MCTDTSGIRALAGLVEQSGEDLGLLAGALAVAGEVDYRSRAADVLRARLATIQTDTVAARYAVDRAAEALRGLADAVDSLPVSS